MTREKWMLSTCVALVLLSGLKCEQGPNGAISFKVATSDAGRDILELTGQGGSIVTSATLEVSGNVPCTGLEAGVAAGPVREGQALFFLEPSEAIPLEASDRSTPSGSSLNLRRLNSTGRVTQGTADFPVGTRTIFDIDPDSMNFFGIRNGIAEFIATCRFEALFPDGSRYSTQNESCQVRVDSDEVGYAMSANDPLGLGAPAQAVSLIAGGFECRKPGCIPDLESFVMFPFGTYDQESSGGVMTGAGIARMTWDQMSSESSLKGEGTDRTFDIICLPEKGISGAFGGTGPFPKDLKGYAWPSMESLVDLNTPGPAFVTATSTMTLDPGPLGLMTQETTIHITLPTGQTIPHVPAGRVGELSIVSELVLNNPHDQAVNVRIDTTDTTNGQPLVLRFNDEIGSTYLTTLGPEESRSITIDGDADTVEIAWAFIKSDREIGAAVNFVTRDVSSSSAQVAGAGPSGTIIAEAGIAASELGLVHVLNVSRRGASDTAIAILNTTHRTASIHLVLKDETGEIVAEEDLELPAGHQQPRFFGQIFGLPAGDFDGSVLITSDSFLAVMILKTLNGFQSSSLPSSTP